MGCCFHWKKGEENEITAKYFPTCHSFTGCFISAIKSRNSSRKFFSNFNENIPALFPLLTRDLELSV
jgi:hypothetical protein